MKQYGCIGKKLTHSFSKEIHAKLDTLVHIVYFIPDHLSYQTHIVCHYLLLFLA